jgi:hypothetical protein
MTAALNEDLIDPVTPSVSAASDPQIGHIKMRVCVMRAKINGKIKPPGSILLHPAKTPTGSARGVDESRLEEHRTMVSFGK